VTDGIGAEAEMSQIKVSSKRVATLSGTVGQIGRWFCFEKFHPSGNSQRGRGDADELPSLTRTRGNIIEHPRFDAPARLEYFITTYDGYLPALCCCPALEWDTVCRWPNGQRLHMSGFTFTGW
jgi:hypothetical protein